MKKVRQKKTNAERYHLYINLKISWTRDRTHISYISCIGRRIVYHWATQFSSVAQLCPTLCARQASLSITNSWSPPKPISIESVMPSNHLILCCPFLLLPSTFPSIRVLSNESALRIRWPKYWSFSFNISPSNEHPELISREAQSLIIFKFINLCPAPWFLQPHHLSRCRHIHIWWTYYNRALVFSCKSSSQDRVRSLFAFPKGYL